MGDAVKEFGIRSKDGSKASMEAFAALGLNGQKMTKTFAAGGPAAKKAFAQVVNAIKQVKDPAVQNAAAVGLFGTQAEDLEINVIASMANVRSQFDMTKNTMEEVRKIKYDTWGKALQGIKRQVETGIVIPIGEKALPAITKFSQSFQKNMPSIGAAAKNAVGAIGKVFSFAGDIMGKLVSHIPVKEVRNALKYMSGGFDSLKTAMRQHGETIEENLGPKTMKIVSIFTKVRSSIEVFKGHLKSLGANVGPIFQSMASSVVPIIQKIGSSVLFIWSQISGFWQENGGSIVSAVTKIFGVVGSIFTGVVSVVKTILPIITPILSNMVQFIGDIIGQIVSFWNENGTMIMNAVKNIFSGINAVIRVLAPVIVGILNMVWGNVKGVIQGALKIVMGVIKIFVGLFTGNFSAMWSGIKQLFVGAVQFIWNAVNLLFIGKILGGIRALATGAITKVAGMWGSIKGFFSGGATAVWNNVVGLLPKISAGFSKVKDIAVSLVRSMWTSIKSHFDTIVSGARALPGKIGEGISSMAGKALNGVKSMGNTLLKGIGNIVNGVIKGLNWAMSKVGVKLEIANWAVPQYANGTNGHPGGPAILGDGGGPELFRTPQGHVGLSPGTDTLMNLPKGTQVVPAAQTQTILSSIPAYAKGNIGGNILQKGFNWVKETGGKAVSAIKDTAIDVFSYISNPSKLLGKLLEKFGVNLPDVSGAFDDIAKGVFSKIKGGALDFLKEKLGGIGGGSWTGGAVPDNAQVRSWVTQALQITGTPLSWLPAMMIKAQKESGFNPKAINLWDSNAKKGIPSKGLFQTIDPTFNSFKMPGMNDIWNPVHNAVAAIRYIKDRYGTVFNTPGMLSMAKGGGYKGYAKGGRVTQSGWAVIGEQGPELMNLKGGSSILSNANSQSQLSNLLSFAQDPAPVSNGTGGNSYEINIASPQISIQGNADESTIEYLKNNFASEIKYLIMQGIKEIESDKQRLSYNS